MRRFLVLAALVLVVALGASGYAAVGCLADEQDAASVGVDPDTETRLQVPDGPLVVLPAGSTSGPGQLVAEEPPETPALPAEVVSATGGGWDIRLEGTELVGAATLRFPVRTPDGVPDDVAEVLLTYYDDQQRQWVPVESRYDGQQQTVTATVEHLSLWNPVTWNYQGLLDAATSSFADLATAAEPDQPSCPGEDLARADGTRVVSDGTSRVKWCYGESDGERLLRLANGRGYPALVTYPAGWDLQRERSGSLAQAVGGRVIEAVTALPDDRGGILLGGGQSVTLYPEQPPGSTALVGVEPSSGGYILGGLEFAGSTVEFVGGKLPGARPGTRLSAIKLSSCIPGLADTVGAAAVDDATNGLGAELVAESLLCVARQAAVQTVYEEFFLSAVEWLADGSRQIVAGARGVADTLRTLYRITITVPAEAGQGSGDCSGAEVAKVYRGNNGNNYIRGTDGADGIYGFGGSDDLYGRSGPDLIRGDDGFDNIFGGDGVDELCGGSSGDEIDGGGQNDTIVGDDGEDYLDGGNEDDRLDGGLEEDVIEGGYGNDTIQGGGGSEGGDATGGLFGGYGNDTILGGEGDDHLWGGPDNDKLYGGTQEDDLIGERGEDYLSGGDADDYIDSEQEEQAARDTVDCGEGYDYVDADSLDQVSSNCEDVSRF